MTSTRIAIAGLGAIGRAVARRLTDGLPGLSLAASPPATPPRRATG